LAELKHHEVRQKATAFQLVFLCYAVICSGAYGLEEVVSASGPGLAMTMILVLPFLYAAPISLACAELASRYPIEGGYYRWVRLAFGDFVGYVTGWLVWITMFATNAAFAVLFCNYLRHFIPGLSDTWHFAIAVALVWITTGLNVRGIQLVGTASVVLTALIFVPFALMTGIGLFHWSYNPFVPFTNPDKTWLAALGDGFLIAMWAYGGFEKMTASAEEVENPSRAFPIALGLAVPMCALSYILPTLVAIAANGDWREWGESHYTAAAEKIGGSLVGASMAAGGLVSNFCILLVTVLAQSRLPMVLADDGLFPPVFQRTHPRYGTPVAALVVGGLVLTALCGLRFAQLAGIYSLVQCLSYLLIYAALYKLRSREDGVPGGFRIPLSRTGVLLMAAPSAAIVLLVIGGGLYKNGALDLQQLLIDAAIFSSGPLSYLFFRRYRRESSANPISL
jgi:amino acid transporter